MSGAGTGGGEGLGEIDRSSPKTAAEIIAGIEADKDIVPPDRSTDYRDPLKKIPLPGMVKSGMSSPSDPGPLKKAATPTYSYSFLAKPGFPHAMRVITATRLGPGYHSTNTLLSSTVPASKRAAIRGNTQSFLSVYKLMAQEFDSINNLHLTQAQLEQAKQIILKNKKALHKGMFDELDNVKPGLSQMIYSVLTPQFSEGLSGFKDNSISLADSPPWDRLNALGFGSYFQAEMLYALDNAEFFANTTLNINGNNDFTLNYKDSSDPNAVKISLVIGNIDKAKNISFKIGSDVPPESRDLAIKHLVLMVATHTQQNNSNQFDVAFGDNPYENLRLLQLAIGVYNLHVPENLIRAYMKELPDDARLRDEFEFWAKHSEVFSDQIASNHDKIINENNPNMPLGANGYKLSLKKVQELLFARVTEDVFPQTGIGVKTSSLTFR